MISRTQKGLSARIAAIPGFLKRVKKNAADRVYRGRYTAADVQWTGSGSDLLATFTITAEELADASDSMLLWTDQDVQRGIRPGLDAQPSRELPLSAGYPDTKQYIFDDDKADDITYKLLSNERLFLSPLIWNLRPATFEAFWNESESSLYLYAGKVYLPDSHHRQQAIQKAVRIWKEEPNAYPKFDPSYQFKVELYFLSKEDEGNYFFDKNQRTRPAEKSKAYDLTTLDDLSLLAKMVISKSEALAGNVNRVTDRLSSENPQVVTLSTLREMMKTFAVSDKIDSTEMEGIANVAATFYDMLAEARKELGLVDRTVRRRIRERLLVDSAVMMQGYAYLMREFNQNVAAVGLPTAKQQWAARLSRLSEATEYRFRSWTGDFFAKRNPLWQDIGVVKPGTERLTVLNSGAARGECGRVLRQLCTVEPATLDLEFLSRG